MKLFFSSLRFYFRATACLSAILICASFSASALEAGSVYLDSGGNGGGGGNSGSGGGGGGNSGSGNGGNRGSGSGGSGSLGSGSGISGSGFRNNSSDFEDSGSRYRGSEDYSDRSGSSKDGSGSDDFDSSNSGSGSDDFDSSNSGSGSDDSESSNSGSGKSGSAYSDSDRREGSSFDNGRSWQTLAARERPDFDGGGFPTRRGEILSLDLTDEQIDMVKQSGFSVVDTVKLKAIGLVMVRLRAPAGMTASDAMKALRAKNANTFYEFDHYFGVTGGGKVGKAGGSMVDMKAPKSKSFTIGMIDTAVWRQATLRSARVDAKDFANSKGKPPFAHGTAVASILHRQGAKHIVSANVFSADGRPYSSAEAIARAVNWMVERKVPVINISIAGPRNAMVDKVVAAAIARGHVVVAAAGNGGPSAPAAYPAASPGAVAVTAVDHVGRVYMNANRGPYIDMSAIGVGIGAEAPDGSLRPHSGTSFAAPFVSASLARCVDKVKPGQNESCIKQMESRARDLGTPGRDPIYGHGLLIP
jgi:Subtilase family